MPPRARGAQGEDAKKAAFNDFVESEMYKICDQLFKVRKDEGTELGKMEKGTEDIIEDWSKLLDLLYKLSEGLKVPRKAKTYEQQFFRTMIFRRLQTDIMEIDGNQYEVTNSANTDHFNCKEQFLNIVMKIEEGFDEDTPLSWETFGSWKKDLVSMLKDFDKKYVKHSKTVNPQLVDIHKKAGQPLQDFAEASFNLQNYHTLVKKDKNLNFPEFRKKALYDKFIEHMTGICKIFKAFANPDTKLTLEEEYDIKHLLEILDIEDWELEPCFKFYFDPLKEAYDKMVDELRTLHENGPLRYYYVIERNKTLQELVIALIKQYNIVKMLAGDDLKRDQFKFMYRIHEKVYDCALKDTFVTRNKDSTEAIMNKVIPELTVFQTMMHIRDVDDRKALDEQKKERKKAEREALGLSEEEEEELVLDIPQPEKKKGKKKVEIDPEVIEAARVAALYKKELATYGRTWIWENYYKDDQDRKDIWLAGAGALRRINIQVLEDVEDFILLKGFTSGKSGQMLNIEGVTQRIEKHLQQKRERMKMEIEMSSEKRDEEEKVEDPIELGVIEDKQRRFLNKNRPHERVWNFFQDDEETKVPHVLRAAADPNLAYMDGRIAELLELIEGMGQHLRMHNDPQWVHLMRQTQKIFDDRETQMEKKMKEYEQMLADANNK